VAWIELARAAIGTLLIVAGSAKVTKAGSIGPFLSALNVPAVLNRTASVGLPIAEVLCGLLLIVGGRQPWSVWPATALTCAFATTLAWARIAGATESCRCFGALDSRHQPPILPGLRAAILAGAAVAMSIAAQGSEPRSVTVTELSMGLLAATVCVTVFTILGSIWHLRRESPAKRNAPITGPG
jgi:uncharacterized membrane protein YphA (DoxX/SURF4 family)